MVNFVPPKRYTIAPYKTGLDNISFKKFKSLPKTKIITLDTETTGLSFLHDKIIMLQLYFPGLYSIAIDFRYLLKGDIKYLKELLENAELIIAANIAFDYNMLKNYNICFENHVFDVLDAYKLINLGKWTAKQNEDFPKHNGGIGRFSLANMTKIYTDVKLDKSVRKEFTTLGNNEFSTKEWEYGLMDAEILYPIYREIRKEAIKLRFTKRVKLEGDYYDDLLFSSQHALCLADNTFNGISFDKKQWLSTKPYFENLARVAHSKLMDAIKKENLFVMRGLFDSLGEEYRKIDINWKSSKQIITFFKNQYNIDLKDKRGKTGAGKEVLENLKHPLAKPILEYRKALKSLDAFGVKFIKKYVQSDNKIHVSYNNMVDTFRVSAKNPNMQQIPHEDMFRNAFVAQVSYLLYTADYPQQEIHVNGDRANCDVTREFYLHGHGDYHSFNASQILSIKRGVKVDIPPKVDGDEEKLNKFFAHPDHKERGSAKVLSFLIPYGGGPQGLADKIGIPIKDAKEIFANYYLAFPKKLEYNKKQEELALTNGYILINNNLSSIKRYFPDFKEYSELKEMEFRNGEETSKMKMLEGKIKRKAPNTTIQGTSALMTKAASIIERKKLIKLGHRPVKDAKLRSVLVTHDEKTLEVWDDPIYKNQAVLLKESMEEAALLYCPSIPMHVFPEFNKFWTH